MTIISRKEAKARGLHVYCSGKPCPRGHVAERYVSDSMCAECRKAWSAAYKRAHPGYDAAYYRARVAAQRMKGWTA